MRPSRWRSFRPLGSTVWPPGDRYGRKPVLIAVLVLMTLATVAIGLVPVYASIGVAAPLLITLLRILQGLFAGGEYGGAVSLMTESAPPGKRGFYGAWQSLTVALGLLAGAGVVAVLPLLLGDAAMNAGAGVFPSCWRCRSAQWRCGCVADSTNHRSSARHRRHHNSRRRWVSRCALSGWALAG